jgi:hypothetical protein
VQRTIAQWKSASAASGTRTAAAAAGAPSTCATSASVPSWHVAARHVTPSSASTDARACHTSVPSAGSGLSRQPCAAMRPATASWPATA